MSIKNAKTPAPWGQRFLFRALRWERHQLFSHFRTCFGGKERRQFMVIKNNFSNGKTAIKVVFMPVWQQRVGSTRWMPMQICVCVRMCRRLTCDSPYVRWNYRAISAELQQWGLLSVMWEGRLPPIGMELLAAAFLPLLSGGWRGIICQHAGSHCFGAGTNAASIRQLDCGRVHTVRLNPSYVCDYTWLFFTGMCTERPWPVIVRMCACERLYPRGAKLNRLRVDIFVYHIYHDT